MGLKFSETDPLDGSASFYTFAIMNSTHYYTLWACGGNNLNYIFSKLGKELNPSLTLRYINKKLECKNTGISEDLLKSFLK